MLEMGILVALGLLFTLAKLSWRGRMWVISHPLTMDIGIAMMLAVLHWGTFSGMMVAAIGALFCSIVLAICKSIFGHVEGTVYFPGLTDVSNKLIAEIEAARNETPRT